MITTTSELTEGRSRPKTQLKVSALAAESTSKAHVARTIAKPRIVDAQSGDGYRLLLGKDSGLTGPEIDLAQETFVLNQHRIEDLLGPYRDDYEIEEALAGRIVDDIAWGRVWDCTVCGLPLIATLSVGTGFRGHMCESCAAPEISEFEGEVEGGRA